MTDITNKIAQVGLLERNPDLGPVQVTSNNKTYEQLDLTALALKVGGERETLSETYAKTTNLKTAVGPKGFLKAVALKVATLGGLIFKNFFLGAQNQENNANKIKAAKDFTAFTKDIAKTGGDQRPGFNARYVLAKARHTLAEATVENGTPVEAAELNESYPQYGRDETYYKGIEGVAHAISKAVSENGYDEKLAGTLVTSLKTTLAANPKLASERSKQRVVMDDLNGVLVLELADKALQAQKPKTLPEIHQVIKDVAANLNLTRDVSTQISELIKRMTDDSTELGQVYAPIIAAMPQTLSEVTASLEKIKPADITLPSPWGMKEQEDVVNHASELENEMRAILELINNKKGQIEENNQLIAVIDADKEQSTVKRTTTIPIPGLPVSDEETEVVATNATLQGRAAINADQQAKMRSLMTSSESLRSEIFKLQGELSGLDSLLNEALKNLEAIKVYHREVAEVAEKREVLLQARATAEKFGNVVELFGARNELNNLELQLETYFEDDLDAINPEDFKAPVEGNSSPTPYDDALAKAVAIKEAINPLVEQYRMSVEEKRQQEHDRNFPKLVMSTGGRRRRA